MPQAVAQVVRKQARSQHPWVFSNEVRRVDGDPRMGDTVLVYQGRRLLGSGMYNPHSLIRIRLYSKEIQDFDRPFIAGRLRLAASRRKCWLPGEEDYRLCYGESDGLPGLVVDKYGQVFVIQAYSAAIDQRQQLVTEVLAAEFGAVSVYERNDFRLRLIEGLQRRTGCLRGTPEAGHVISESGARFLVDIACGQKTGFYFDQRLTRRKVRELASGRRVLDVHCYTGAFSVNAALGGAVNVLGIDSSAVAVAMAEKNAALNGVGDRCAFRAADAEQAMTELQVQNQRFDLVLLDPPSLVPVQRDKPAGVRVYRRLNSLAMGLVERNGLLITSSCSHHLSWDDFSALLIRAAIDAGRECTVVERRTQGPDHPILLAMPETEYLRVFVLSLD